MIVTLRPRARADLASIWHYSASEWGVEQADHYISQIVAAVDRAAAWPGIGSDVFGLPREYRKVHAGTHRVIYRYDDRQLIVVAIVHEREDVPDDWDGLS